LPSQNSNKNREKVQASHTISAILPISSLVPLQYTSSTHIPSIPQSSKVIYLVSPFGFTSFPFHQQKSQTHPKTRSHHPKQTTNKPTHLSLSHSLQNNNNNNSNNKNQNANCLRTRISPASGPGPPVKGRLKSVTHFPPSVRSIQVTRMADTGSTRVWMVPELSFTSQL